ncbi:D-alanyl-D-alanine carboxypeptidase/D-alanyl-D-alanine-endopeptidase [Marinitoga sp. 1138]|uniref:D-alanyl-D-alanine carboxypeptidase/D-alanyl-D-alanine-endopeptidase n=1 Tax=Marinitoga sp. 1138 TaxID=1643334 RepID=UPI001585D327|nr:D-alanyl-D-alanine carboxypeptidase [Marinitoga sp. 1138]NUU98433.1 hypothetical protein [Marinitoga sp. 1138]
MTYIEKKIKEFKGFCGILVKDLKKNEIIYSYNENKFFTPASVTKLFTTFAVFEIFKKEYIFSTKFYFTNGDLIVKGCGDPTIDLKTFDMILNKIKERSGKVFFDTLVIDDSLFNNNEFFGYGWMYNDEENPYIKPFNIKDFVPENNYYAELLELLKPLFIKHRFPIECINSGNVEEKETPFYIHKSAEIDKITEIMMKNSDNYIAEMFFRMLSVKKYGKGEIEKSIEVLKEELYKNLGLEYEEDYVITDGAGLSRYNLISPLTAVKVFEYMLEKYGDRFLNILAYTKSYGTLENRFNFDVWGKTGTLTGVSGLTGLLITKKGRKFIFSLFENNYVYEKTYGKTFENDIINYLYNTF